MRWGFFIFFIFTICSSCNQSSNTTSNFPVSSNDSIQYWANTAKNDKDLDWDERIALVNKAYSENSLLNDKLLRTKNLSRISLAYSNLGDSVNFRRSNTELISLANEIGDKIAHGEAHWDLGDYFRSSLPDSAYYHYKEAYSLFRTAELGEKMDYPGRILLSISSLREINKDYIGAEKDVIAAIEELKSIDATDRLYNSFNALGMIQNGMMKFDKALEYFNKAREYIQYKPETRQNYLHLQNENNTASTYLRKGDYKKAYERYENLMNNALKEDETGLLIRKVYSSAAISGFKNGSLNADQAMGLIEKSNQGLDSIGRLLEKARNKQFTAEILFAENKIPEAINNALEAKLIAENTGNNDRLLRVLKFLNQTDLENSAAHGKAYFDLSEKLQLQERTIQDKFARIQMETDEVIEENQSLAKRTELLAGISIGLLVLGIGIFTIISQRISNQRLKFRQRQQESNQEIYNLMLAQHGKLEEGKKSEQQRVSEELHDGILGQMLGIRLILSGLNERNDASAIEQRAELIGKLQELEEEIRTISHELNAASYQKVHNFILSIKDLINSVEKASKVAIHFSYDDQFEWDALDGNLKINSYRVTQELLQNCVKHAKCNSINVAFQIDNNLLNLIIEDDGIGFDDSKSKKGIGLRNIISRVKKMGGKLEINSKLGYGTKVSVSIPNVDLKMESPKFKELRNTVLETKTAS